MSPLLSDRLFFGLTYVAFCAATFVFVLGAYEYFGFWALLAGWPLHWWLANKVLNAVGPETWRQPHD